MSLLKFLKKPSRQLLTEAEIAQAYGPHLNLKIASGDDMYTGDLAMYLRVAYVALRFINLSLAVADRPAPQRILDFPCGYGRVSRLLKLAFPAAELTAADLDRSAVDFCATEFGATPLYSAVDPSEIPLRGRFDLIFCGSLLTHLQAERWAGFLEFFQAALNPGGLLVFSTHSDLAAEWLITGYHDYGLPPASITDLLTQYQATGFGYVDYAPGQNYGISLSTAAWVATAAAKVKGWQCVAYFPKIWLGPHDVWAYLRSPS